MSSRYTVLNLLLCLVILLLVFENYETWNDSFGLLSGTGVISQRSGVKNENPPWTGSPNDLESVNLISEKNIFSPERTEFPIPAAIGEAQRPVVRPQIVLYGVAIGEDYQSATVTNPESALRKEERETRTVKIGEKIGEYTLAKILPDRIIMARNEDTFEVILNDYKNPKRKVQARAKATAAMMANLQPDSVPPLGEALTASPSQESAEEPKEPAQKQLVALPFNKYTYQALGPSASISRGRIYYTTPGP